jgi:hypothetical protein
MHGYQYEIEVFQHLYIEFCRSLELVVDNSDSNSDSGSLITLKYDISLEVEWLVIWHRRSKSSQLWRSPKLC